MRALVLVSLWTLFGFLPQQQAPRDQPARTVKAAGTASISGRVYAAASGAPLQGALVVLMPASGLNSVTVQSLRDSQRGTGPGAPPGGQTDAAGQFRITGVAPGVYRLIANPSVHAGRYLAAGHGAVRGNDAGKRITIAAGDNIQNADIALPGGLAIEGRVTDGSGEPLTRVSVFASRVMAGTDTPQRVPHSPSLTDDLGRYRIYGLEPGAYIVAATTSQLLAMSSGSADNRVYSVSLGSWEREPFMTTFHPSVLGDAAAPRLGLGSQDLTGIDIVLQRSRRFQLSGTVVDSQGRPAEVTSGVLSRAGLGTIGNMSFRTDPQGRFDLRALEPGDYRLQIGSGFAPSPTSVNGRTEFVDAPITVNADSTDMVVMTQPGIGLAGRIVFAEGTPSPVPEMRIVFRRPDPTRPSDVVATFGDELRFFGSDVFGSQLVRVAPPAGWIVKAVTLGGADITDVPTVFGRQHNDQLQIVLTSRSSAVEGTVRGDAAGPLPDATVYVFSEDRASWSISSPRTTVTDVGPNGRFSAGGLAAGRYYAIAIERSGFRLPPQAGTAFFELLSRDATPFIVGEAERRTVDLPLWHWPE